LPDLVSAAPERAVGRRVLVVSEDLALAQVLRQGLELDGYQVRIERDAGSGLAAARSFRPQLVITDLSHVVSGGGNLLERLRTDHEGLPVLVLASQSEEATRLAGFRLGLDDYLLRPFRVTELHHRIEVLLRSPSGAPPPPAGSVRFGDIEIQPASRTVLRRGEPVLLRLKEFDLLMALVTRGGGVISRMDLLREVWGYRSWVATRTVDTHVAELRRKLETDPAHPRHILTVRKIGYRLQR